MSKTVEFAFDSLQKVKIKDIDAAGLVTSRLANAEGQNEYKITYWLDGRRQQEWFYEIELTEAQ